MIIWSSINCPTVICLPTVCYFSQEKPLLKPTAPCLLSLIFAFVIYFSLPFIFRSIKPKIQKYLAALYFIWCSIYQSITTFSCQLAISVTIYFAIYTTKIPKIFTLLSLLDLTFASDLEGIENPFIALVARFLIVCVRTRWLVCRLLLDWYLGSQNWRKYLRYFAASPFPLQGKTNACSRGRMYLCAS